MIRKLFLNENDEPSWRKIGSTIAAVGIFLAAGAIPGAQILIVGKALAALGGSIIAIGQFDKNDRKEEKK